MARITAISTITHRKPCRIPIQVPTSTSLWLNVSAGLMFCSFATSLLLAISITTATG